MKEIGMGVVLWALVCGYVFADETMDLDSTGTTIMVQGTLIDAVSYYSNGQISDEPSTVKSNGENGLNSGDPAGVLVGKKVYILVFPSKAFAKYAGKTVEINGDFYDDNLIYPESAFEVEKNNKKTIKLKGYQKIQVAD